MMHDGWTCGHDANSMAHDAWGGGTKTVSINGDWQSVQALAADEVRPPYQWQDSADGIHFADMPGKVDQMLFVVLDWSADWQEGRGWFRCRTSNYGTVTRLNVNRAVLGVGAYWQRYNTGTPIPIPDPPYFFWVTDYPNEGTAIDEGIFPVSSVYAGKVWARAGSYMYRDRSILGNSLFTIPLIKAINSWSLYLPGTCVAYGNPVRLLEPYSSLGMYMAGDHSTEASYRDFSTPIGTIPSGSIPVWPATADLTATLDPTILSSHRGGRANILFATDVEQGGGGLNADQANDFSNTRVLSGANAHLAAETIVFPSI
jgi:hypothetical protein